MYQCSLAVQIHWAVAAKQIIYIPATVKHRGESLDRFRSLRYSFTPSAYLVFRRIKRSGMPCRKNSSKTLQQQFGNIRACAISPSSPFKVCCLDLSGPWIVLKSKKGRDTRTNTNSTKVYVAVFRCLYTKNTHLEIIETTEKEPIIQAITRLSSLYGTPSHVTVDKDLAEIQALRDSEFVTEFEGKLYYNNGFNFRKENDINLFENGRQLQKK